MRVLFIITISLVGTFQASSQIKINYTFVDPCEGSIISPNYELLGPNTKLYKAEKGGIAVDTIGNYMLMVTIWRGDIMMGWHEIKYYDETKSYTDTLVVPRLLTEGKALHNSNPRSYFRFCNEVANGLIVDYHRNGKKRMEGTFRNGLPVSNLKYYDENGQLVKTDVFKSGIYKKQVFNKR